MKMFLKSCTSCFLALNLRIISQHFWFSQIRPVVNYCLTFLNIYIHTKYAKKRRV